jgi:murein DD-endopeptidase / murein LD-carboxypeptidase
MFQFRYPLMCELTSQLAPPPRFPFHPPSYLLEKITGFGATAGLISVLMASSLSSCKSPAKMAKASGEDLSTYVSKPIASVTPVIEAGTRTVLSYRDPLQIKYGRYLQTDPGNIINVALYQFIDRWLHTPYLWGGVDERGIDCSAFLQKLLAEVYQISIPRTSVEQFYTDNVEKFASVTYLSEGDLVFFHTIADRPISHVGLYLQNGMFVNSSSSKGVSIASLKDPYWKKRLVGCGRVRQ